MLIVRHRCNTTDDLNATDPCLGVEIDIRSAGKELILAHDAFASGQRFETWLEQYRHRFIILNVKEEGLEVEILRLLRREGIEDFFLLDQSFPFLLKTAQAGERRCAVRVSEYESVDTALAVSHLVDWVWVDTFTKIALQTRESLALKQAGLKLCLVSPELVGRIGADHVRTIQEELRARGIVLDAVCTKTPEFWMM